ncbi:MAG: hypothetical protein EPO20_26570 [Betaproteobacteria bacterium]|nr:MAG: hypothetical protein EPO20_26570 [Betaproteobacteria bacterium]
MAKENGCKRQPRSDANWSRPLGNGENLVLSFRCGPWGGGAIGGKGLSEDVTPNQGRTTFFCQRRKVARSGAPGAASITKKEER